MLDECNWSFCFCATAGTLTLLVLFRGKGESFSLEKKADELVSFFFFFSFFLPHACLIIRRCKVKA